MIKKATITGLCIVASLQGALFADITTVNFDSGSKTVFDQNTAASNALTGGTTADGNGTVLQLGYYSGASIANNFLENWIPLSGETSLNTALIAGASPAETYNKTSIGDLNVNGAGNGTFGLSLDFIAGSGTSGNSLPSTGIPLSIRFYNSTTIASSTFFNVVSDDLWVWKTPTTPPQVVNISLDNLGLEWQSIAQGQAANTAFHTTIALAAIPEPSTLALVGLALGFAPVAWLRRSGSSQKQSV